MGRHEDAHVILGAIGLLVKGAAGSEPAHVGVVVSLQVPPRRHRDVESGLCQQWKSKLDISVKVKVGDDVKGKVHVGTQICSM